MAHLAFKLVTRLFVYSVGGFARLVMENLSQSDANDVVRRVVAWSFVEFYCLGCVAWGWPCVYANVATSTKPKLLFEFKDTPICSRGQNCADVSLCMLGLGILSSRRLQARMGNASPNCDWPLAYYEPFAIDYFGDFLGFYRSFNTRRMACIDTSSLCCPARSSTRECLVCSRLGLERNGFKPSRALCVFSILMIGFSLAEWWSQDLRLHWDSDFLQKTSVITVILLIRGLSFFGKKDTFTYKRTYVGGEGTRLVEKKNASACNIVVDEQGHLRLRYKLSRCACCVTFRMQYNSLFLLCARAQSCDRVWAYDNQENSYDKKNK